MNFNLYLIDLGAQDIQRKQLPDSYYDFVEAMNDDLNTPKALGIFHSWMRQMFKKIKTGSIDKIEIGEAWNFLTNFDSVFGFLSEKSFKIPLKIEKLMELREQPELKIIGLLQMISETKYKKKVGQLKIQLMDRK